MKFNVAWQADGSATVLGRLTARNGTGAATGVKGEGRWLKQADIASIICGVFDNDLPGTAPIAMPTVTIADSVLDVPVTNEEIWDEDDTGYNFLHDLDSSNFPTVDHDYMVKYTVTLTGGTVFHGTYEGLAEL